MTTSLGRPGEVGGADRLPPSFVLRDAGSIAWRGGRRSPDEPVSDRDDERVV